MADMVSSAVGVETSLIMNSAVGSRLLAARGRGRVGEMGKGGQQTNFQL